MARRLCEHRVLGESDCADRSEVAWRDTRRLVPSWYPAPTVLCFFAIAYAALLAFSLHAAVVMFLRVLSCERCVCVLGGACYSASVDSMELRVWFRIRPASRTIDAVTRGGAKRSERRVRSGAPSSVRSISASRRAAADAARAGRARSVAGAAAPGRGSWAPNKPEIK